MKPLGKVPENLYKPAADGKPTYTCINCGCSQSLRVRDAVKCKDCGGKILFKNRHTASAVYLAR